MFANLPQLEQEVDQLIDSGRYNDALANIFVGVHNHTRQPAHARDFLYYPELDARLLRLAQQLAVAMGPLPEIPVGGNTLIVASEMYEVGGHSRVILDVANHLPNCTIVLTDMFWSSRKNMDRLNWLYNGGHQANVIVLPQTTLWDKCRALRLLTQSLNPSCILYFNHHEDPMPFVGTLTHQGSRKVLVHHCDNNASLGNTLPDVQHVDFAREMVAHCSHQLQRPASILPLYVKDNGRKSLDAFSAATLSAVTSGADHKFSRTGELSLSRIAATVLSAIGGSFFHIGSIDAGWVVEIRGHLRAQGLEPGRFVSLGSVPSLWGTLAGLDAQIYIGSAPVGGGRAAIEAQGCGYPSLFFKIKDQGPAMAVESLYASSQLGWATLDELGAVLRAMAPHCRRLSEAARRYYEDNYSRQCFASQLRLIVTGEPDGTH